VSRSDYWLSLRGRRAAERLRQLASAEDNLRRATDTGRAVEQPLLRWLRAAERAVRSLGNLLYHRRPRRRRLAAAPGLGGLAERVAEARRWVAGELPDGREYAGEEAYQVTHPLRDWEQRREDAIRRAETGQQTPRPADPAPALRSLADAIEADLPVLPPAPRTPCPIRLNGRQVLLPGMAAPHPHRLTDGQQRYLRAFIAAWPAEPSDEGCGSPKHVRSELRKAVPGIERFLPKRAAGRPPGR
jgi:hypothetical protein